MGHNLHANKSNIAEPVTKLIILYKNHPFALNLCSQIITTYILHLVHKAIFVTLNVREETICTLQHNEVAMESRNI